MLKFIQPFCVGNPKAAAHVAADLQCWPTVTWNGGVTRSMVIPGPETEVIGESRSRGLGAQPPDAEKGLLLGSGY